MKTGMIVIIIACVLVVVTCISAVAYYAVPLDVDRVKADITLDSRAAFKLTNDSFMHFGTIDTNNIATRAIIIENIRGTPITATVYIEGPEWVTVSENRIRLDSGENREIVFTADPPDDAEHGHYEMDITVVYRRW